VWAHRELFDLQWSGGAPPEHAFAPDEFTKRWGQNWGVPLYKWAVHRKTNFGWWRQRVEETCKIFQLFRIDHVLGFYRVYAFPWKPEDNWQYEKLTTDEAAKKTGGLLPRFWPGPDDSEKQKKANRKQGEEILRIVLEAAGDSTVIAEDLGVVPDYVRPSLLELEIPGFKIPHWERNEDYTWKDAAKYPRLSIVTPATHDHEPLASQWHRLWAEHEDAKAKQDHHRAYVSWLDLQRFVWWCGWDGNHIPREFTPELHKAYCRRLFDSNSWLAVLMITDVFAQTARFNVPGPMSESNWAERIEKPVSLLDQDESLLVKTEMVERLIREGGRCSS
jgi:4-alpha-glucanotransferase